SMTFHQSIWSDNDQSIRPQTLASVLAKLLNGERNAAWRGGIPAGGNAASRPPARRPARGAALAAEKNRDRNFQRQPARSRSTSCGRARTDEKRLALDRSHHILRMAKSALPCTPKI